MNAAYLAISYKCNQKCSFCPCSKEEKRYPYSNLEQLKERAEAFVKKQGVDMIVLSGGEPTIHPDFIGILKYIIQELGCNVTILSNGEMYSNNVFVDKIKSIGATDKITAITTLHSQDPKQHEGINGSSGSLKRSCDGLKNMFAIGVDVIIKHCITKANYKELVDFYRFVDETFDEGINLQLCSIDYCGMEKDELEQHMLSFVELRPYLEAMFDYYIERCEQGSLRHMYAINMPFCSCDPYYWNILVGRGDTYRVYGSPDENGEMDKIDQVERNVDTFGKGCQFCSAREICPGTYKTAFEYYGEKIIEPYT